VLTAAAAAIAAIRKAKSQARLPMKNPVALLILTAAQPHVDALAAAGDDVRSAGRVAAIELRATDGAEPAHDVMVQEAPPLPSYPLTGKPSGQQG
jgi:valyl-tRNA synthetase